MKVTPKNLDAVLEKISKQAKEDKRDAKVWCDELNEVCDRLLSEDFFGTEGQCDPRGDHRG